ncbi:MAG: hypothetical protein ABIP94_08985, partial [Planctomycetota bacterium]
LALAAAWFVAREGTAEGAPSAPRVHSLELPALHGLVLPDAPQSYELDADKCSVRFFVEGPHGAVLAACPGVSGRLSFAANDPTGRSGELELHLDLASLQRLGADSAAIDGPSMRGLPRSGELVYRAQLVSSTTSDLPGVTQQSWLGTLRSGTHALRLPMQLWQCLLPGRRLRLQGRTSVDAASLGMPARRWLDFFEGPDTITLGFDLAWKRSRVR